MNKLPPKPFVNYPPCEGVPAEQLGGAIVPPSDFQYESTKSPENTGFAPVSPHAHASAGAQAHAKSSEYLIDRLVSKVRAMRKMQTRYFATRDGLVLRQSMALEREVDKLLEQFPPDKQQFTQTSFL